MRTMLTFLAVLAALSATAGRASTVYVKPDGTGDAPTIQAGIDLAVPGDTVLLASGIFKGVGNRNIIVPEKMISILSETGDPKDCIIDCEGSAAYGRYAFWFQSGTVTPVLAGVTITDADAAPAALYNDGSWLVIRDCAFVSNRGHSGGACCFAVTGEVTVTNCSFVSNECAVYDQYSSAGGGAILIEGVVTNVYVDGCTFAENRARVGGAIFCKEHEAQADISNSIFYHNSATVAGGAIAVENMGADIAACTFFANSAPAGTGSAIDAFFATSVANCIITGGVGGPGYVWGDIEHEPIIGCTDIYGNEGGDWVGLIAPYLGQYGNFSACPSFCNCEIEPFDLHLCSSSPCLPGQHPDGASCGLIGALGQGCTCGPTATVPTTWGAIKARFQ